MIDFRKKDGIQRAAPQYFKRYNSKNVAQGGLQKVDPYQRKKGSSGGKSAANLNKSREVWMEMQNRQLARSGLACRVDHRTREAQGDDRRATIYQNIESYKQYKKTGKENEITLKNREIRQYNKEMARMNKQEEQLIRQKKIIKENVEITRERNRSVNQKIEQLDHYKEISRGATNPEALIPRTVRSSELDNTRIRSRDQGERERS
jgi:hypothetical protein